MRTPARLGLCGTVLAIGLVCIWSAFVRSLIPTALDGTVTEIAYVGATTGRAQQLRVGTDLVEVDRSVAEAVKPGDRIVKKAWEPTLRTSSRDVPLQAGPEVLQFVLLLPVATGATWVVSGRRSLPKPELRAEAVHEPE